MVAALTGPDDGPLSTRQLTGWDGRARMSSVGWHLRLLTVGPAGATSKDGSS